MAPKRNPSPSASWSFEEFQSELSRIGLTLSPVVDFSVEHPITAEKNMELNYRWISMETWSSSRVIITLGQMRAGLTSPLYDPENPFFHEAMERINCGVFQLSGNPIRILSEFVRRSKGEGRSLVLSSRSRMTMLITLSTLSRRIIVSKPR